MEFFEEIKSINQLYENRHDFNLLILLKLSALILTNPMVNNKAHILIIDDVVDNIQVVMNILKEDQYDYSFATQGEEALTLIKKSEGGFNFA